MSISPGEIVLITGSSGSGKTTLLNLMSSKKGGRGTPILQGDLFLPSNYKPSSLLNVHSNKALIELFKGIDVSSSLYLMGIVGLSDAFVYLKRFKELSEGQKYRFLLAYMLSSGANVWLLDEFCSNLDPMTAKAVAGGIQRIARRFGATVIAASPHYENFISSFNPDRVLRMTSTGEGTIIEGAKFIELSGFEKRKITVPSLKISQRYVGPILNNQKVTTIRKGRININRGLMLLESEDQSIIVNVKNVKYKSLLNLNDFDALKEGFESKVELLEELGRVYPKISKRSIVTIIEFEQESKIG
jgi:ABC-type multidrug transport system ATPase subunit